MGPLQRQGNVLAYMDPQSQTCEQGVMTMGDKEAHQVAVAHSVNGLHNDLVESEAGWEVLSWDRGHPVHPLACLLIKEVVVHATVLQEVGKHWLQRRHVYSHVYSSLLFPMSYVLYEAFLCKSTILQMIWY